LIELSLHILDLIENSINAEADEIWISLEINEEDNLLILSIEDNGKGFSVDSEELFDPFYTTKTFKVVGLGLSLAKSSAEGAGGEIKIGKSENLGGAKVILTFQISHVDRVPMGDLGSVIAGIFITNPNINIQVKIIQNKQLKLLCNTKEYCDKFPEKNEMEIYQIIEKEINNLIVNLGI
jgi:DNA mismatch repair ATPase MutL